MKSIQEFIDAQLAARAELDAKVISIIEAGFSIGQGHAKRGLVQNHVYHALGFQGRCGDDFARFMNKLMVEHGYRVSYYSGQRVYYGLEPK